jgi:site-specific recombinase
MFWIRTSSPHANSFDLQTGQLHNARIRFVIHVLERNPEWKERVSATLRSLVAETSARNLFTEVGLGQYKGFLAESWDVIFARWLPRPAQERDLSELFVRIFDNDDDATWVSHIPSSLMGQLAGLVRGSEENVFRGWHAEIYDALLILGSRIGAMGTTSEIVIRLRESDIEHLGFIRLNYALVRLVDAVHRNEPSTELGEQCLREIANCRLNVKKVYDALEHSGVSVGLVYTLENLSRSLTRVELLLNLLAPPSDSSPDLLIEFLSSLVRERLSQSTIGNLVRTNLHLLSSKIVERAGETGEHYIARNRAEYFQMLRAGLGGGAIMVGTTLMKFWLSVFKAAPLFEGLFFSLNYATSFVVLQLSGFTLATKQPSATASTLAGKLRHLEADGEVTVFVDEICLMTRTQCAAFVGNLMGLLPLGIALDCLLYFTFKTHFISQDSARHVLHSLNPLHSLTIPAAALTGVWLWLSSLIAGWLENWVVFRRIPEALASRRRLIQVFGKKGAAKIGKWTLDNAALIGGNVSLGFLLGFTASIGHFTGLPLDVRHVTLASAQLIFALSALVGNGLAWSEAVLPCLGVIFVGLLNFAVGYSLAFAVAVRAREVKRGGIRRLFRAVRVRLLKHPRDFFLPSRA